MALNVTVFAPMPRARVTMAADGEAGALLQTAKSEPEVLQQVVHKGADDNSLQAQ